MAFATNAVDGCRVYFEDDGGAGAPVVFQGGFLDPVDLVREAPLARAVSSLPSEFRCIFVDHRGHGRTDTPHDPAAYAIEHRVADVVAVIDALGIPRVHFVGMSWGARLGFGVAEHAPERLASLVAIGQQPFAIDPGGPLARLVGDALHASVTEGIEALVLAFESVAGRYPEDVRQVYLASDAAAMRAAWEAALAEGDVATDLASWDVPCLVCVAEDDQDFFDQARRAAALIPGAAFVSMAGIDHLGMDTAEVDPVLPAVLRLLRSTR